MPNTIEWIGESAFLDCTNLSSFTWSKNLKDIGVDAFSGTKFYEKLLQDDKGIYDLPSGILVYVGTNYFDDNTMFEQFDSYRIDCLIGSDFLNQISAKIDYENKHLVI